jgi:hypothetical protein
MTHAQLSSTMMVGAEGIDALANHLPPCLTNLNISFNPLGSSGRATSALCRLLDRLRREGSGLVELDVAVCSC